MKPLIVGIDPGSTSAVAMLNFEGELVALESGKNFPPSEIITEIVGEGKPIIVTSDKADTPSKVKKISNSVGAYTFELEKDLSQERKRELGEGENSHEVDASAAAKHAYKALRNNIEKIKQIADEEGVELEELAQRYFEQDKELIPDKENEENEEKELKNRNPFKEKAQRLEEKVERLEKEIDEMKQKVEIKENQRRKMQSKYDKLKAGKTDEIIEEDEIKKRDEKITEKNQEISQLEQELKRSHIREKQYKKAVEMIEDGAEIIPLVNDSNPGQTPFVTRSKDFRDKMREKGEKVYHIDQVKGVELGEKFVLENINEDAEDIIQRYRDSR